MFLSGPLDIADVPSRRMALSVIVALVLALLIVLATGVQGYMDLTVRRGIDVSFWRTMRWPALWWFGWVLLTPVIVELAWRLRPDSARKGVRVLLLVAACVVFFVVHVAYQVAVMQLPYYRMEHASLAEAIQFHVITSLYLNFFVYWTIVGVSMGARAYTNAQRQALGAARLERELTAAQLDILRAQLHPHFVFNALNGISALMHRDPDTAERMITKLGNLLRRALMRSDRHEVTLREEVDQLSEYLDLERMRFGDGLQVVTHVEPGLDDVLVPSFLYQPLVENALKHGIGRHGHRGRLRITARRIADRLVLAVADDGPGIGDDSSIGSGVGLVNLEDRLRTLYSAEFEIDFRDVEPTGLEVVVTIPLRRLSR